MTEFQMTEAEAIARRFVRRLDAEIGSLGAMDSIDVHIDELVEGEARPQERLDTSLALFEWTRSALAEKLQGIAVMLLIPLHSRAFLDLSPVPWESIAAQLGSTPPSIYLMRPSALLQFDPAERFVCPNPLPRDRHSKLVGTYYQCWRLSTDPVEDGWNRDIRIISAEFV
jgi:hypothetical protein